MTAGVNPYVTPPAPADDDLTNSIYEATIIAAHTMLDIGGGVMAMMDTYNGTVPGPTLRVNVGESIIVRLINTMSHETATHWHGADVANHKDGSPFTQDGVPPGGPVPPHGTYLYKLRFPRPGLYWYHPHHHGSTNQVFKGLYGAIIVTEPLETALVGSILPAAADTLPIILSDTTVCKAPGSNDAQTYPNTLPWVGGGVLPAQNGPTPATLCELPTALDEEGNLAAASFVAGEIPNIQVIAATPGVPTNEGQTVLTNGMNVGGRAGSPSAPGALDAGGEPPLDILRGQGLRLQIFNAATIRYFRLLLTTSTGVQVPLFRIGGEGGLIDHPVLEGGVISGFDTKYTSGEILLPPGTRADVVAAIPIGEPIGSVLTMWTQDYQRTGAGYAKIPTVPVMHLNVAGTVAGAPYSISTATTLRSGPDVVEVLPAPTGTLLNPAAFVPAKLGLAAQNIQITTSGTHTSFDHVVGTHDVTGPYTGAAHMGSSRYANAGDILELTVENTTNADHPFHEHGFPVQPISLTHPTNPDFTWPYAEFRDNINILPGYTLTFRIRIDHRNLVDDVTPGGELGRWMLHCHIFFHAHLGMVSELVVTAPDGSERPYVDVNGSWAYAATGGMATRTGTYAHPDGVLPLASLTSTTDGVTPIGTIVDNLDGTWSWSYMGADVVTYVYITATDTEGRKDQTLFRLKVGGTDDGADNGDPHIKTVDGKHYDFQSAGEFTLLRDPETGLEIQVRQTPVKAANPVTDSYSGIRACVSVNTAVAARLGRHRMSYQQARDGKSMQLFIDGKPVALPKEGRDLGEHRLTAEAVSGGGTAIRVDFSDQTVLIITPLFWSSYGVWYLNVSVAHTQADQGIMGRIPKGTWLPALPNGNTVGPKPASLHDRWVALYRTFADAWRVTSKSSLFVYAPGTSTKTFTDREWPAEKAPCRILPQLDIPGAPTVKGMELEKAEKICRRVTIDGLHENCVFDVATTGDKIFAEGYELVQKLRQRATGVQVVADKAHCRPGESVVITAIVSNLYRDAEKPPRGTVTFFVNDEEASRAVKLDDRCTAKTVLNGLKAGEYRIRAEYAGSKSGPQASSSPNLILVVGRDVRKKEPVHKMTA